MLREWSDRPRDPQSGKGRRRPGEFMLGLLAGLIGLLLVVSIASTFPG